MGMDIVSKYSFINKNNPEEMKVLEDAKEQARDVYLEGELDESEYLVAERSYKQGLVDLTTKVLLPSEANFESSTLRFDENSRGA
jgi:hypothetical protein